MKKIKSLVVVAGILLCVSLVLSCPGDSNDTKDTNEGVAPAATDWIWEVRGDDYPVQFAAGISTLEGTEASATEFFQTYTLNEPYERGNPSTGKIKITTDNDLGIEMPVMRDAMGFDPERYWPDNKEKGAPIPKRTPVLEDVVGPNGTMVKAVHLSGTILQRGSEDPDPNNWEERKGNFNEPFGAGSPADDYRFCASWPTISLYATPTLEALKKFRDDGYGYTFWIKVNKDYNVYSSYIENWDYRAREAYEPKHYFGIVAGREPLIGKNYTTTPVGEWKQIKVVYDPARKDCNMMVAQWVYMYGIQGMYPGDDEPGDMEFNPQHSVRLIWDLALPQNGGTEGTEFQENTISTGRHEYDIYIYDLRFLYY